jgi:hypothetical protein
MHESQTREKTNVNLTFIGASHYITGYWFLSQRISRASVIKNQAASNNQGKKPLFVLKHKRTSYIYIRMFFVFWYLIFRPALHILVFTAAILIFKDVYIHMYCISFILDYRIRNTQRFAWFICNFMSHWVMPRENYSCCCECAFSKTGICFIIKWRFRSKQDNQQFEFK